MRFAPIVFCALLSAIGCQSKLSPRLPQADAGHIRPSPIEAWSPVRPTWINLPAVPPPGALTYYDGLTSMFEQGEHIPEPPLAPTMLDSDLAAGARYVSEHLPETIPWHDEIRQAAQDVVNGRLQVTTPQAIEPSSELGTTHNPYLSYDGAHDRLVYRQFDGSPLALRADLVYALAERAHLHELARRAGVTSRVFAMTLRQCDNLRSEFQLVTYLHAIQSMAAWVKVDPNLRPNDTFGHLNGRLPASMMHDAIYPSIEFFLDESSLDARTEVLIARDAINHSWMQYPGHIADLCGRYVISRGPFRGRYLLPSDVTPWVLRFLARIPELNAPADTPSQGTPLGTPATVPSLPNTSIPLIR